MCLSYLWVVFILVFYGAFGGELAPRKTYTGYRVNKSSMRNVYYCDMVICIVEVMEDNKPINCEFVEVDQDDIREAMLKNLTSIKQPVSFNIEDMILLMDKCNELDQVTPEEVLCQTYNICGKKKEKLNSFENIGSGLVPHTMWCGRGNIATMYFDLGSNSKLDMCCRTHDYCPTKIVPGDTRYNLTNELEYTCSHCLCDRVLKKCLHKHQGLLGSIIKFLYFDVIKNKCIEEIDSKMQFVSP